MTSPETGRQYSFTRFGAFLFGLTLLAVFLLVARHFGEDEELFATLSRTRPLWLILALVFQAGTYLCYTSIWHASLRRMNAPVPFKRLIPLSIAKLFMDQIAPSAGLGGSLLVMRSLSRSRVPKSSAAAALLVGLAGYYVAYTILFGVALTIVAAFGAIRPWMLLVAIGFGFIVLGFAIIILLEWSGALSAILPRRLRGWRSLRPFFDALRMAPAAFAQDWTLLLEASIFASGIFILDIMSLWAILQALAIPLSLPFVAASFMVAAVAGTIGMIPGGLGIFEGSQTGMLVFFGLSIENALAATLILRGFTYWLPLLPGIFIVRREFQEKNPADSETAG